MDRGAWPPIRIAGQYADLHKYRTEDIRQQVLERAMDVRYAEKLVSVIRVWSLLIDNVIGEGSFTCQISVRRFLTVFINIGS